MNQPCIVYVLRLLKSIFYAASVTTTDGYLSRTSVNILVNVLHQLFAHKQCYNINVYQHEFHETISAIYYSVLFSNQYMLVSSNMLFDTIFFLAQLFIKNMTDSNNTSESFELNTLYQKVCHLLVQKCSQQCEVTVLISVDKKVDIPVNDFLNAMFSEVLGAHETRKEFNNTLSDFCQLTRLQKSCVEANVILKL